jgi:hypothetical protein
LLPELLLSVPGVDYLRTRRAPYTRCRLSQNASCTLS